MEGKKTDTATDAKTGAQIRTKRYQRAGYPLDKSVVAHQCWKLCRPLGLHLLLIVGFEIPVAGLVKGNQNSHDFAQVWSLDYDGKERRVEKQ